MALDHKARVGLVVGGGAVAAVAVGGLLYLRDRRSASPTSASGLSLSVLGYAVGTNAGAAVSPTVTVSEGQVVLGAVELSNRGAAQQVGVRAYVVLLGQDESSAAFLQAPALASFAGTVEGHLFAVPGQFSASEEVAEVALPAGSFLRPQTAKVVMYTAGIRGPIASASASPSLTVLWVAGPASAVSALPSEGGTISGSGLAMTLSVGAIVPSFNIAAG